MNRGIKLEHHLENLFLYHKEKHKITNPIPHGKYFQSMLIWCDLNLE